MRARIICSLCALLLSCGCSLTLDPDKKGYDCDGEHPCDPGQVCNPDTGRCEKEGTQEDGGLDGDGGEDGGDTGLLPNGSQCADDGECQSDNCNNSICCDYGNKCCTKDSHCSNNLACNTDDFTCFATCSELSQELDIRCADGFHCDPTGCVEDQGGASNCDEDSDCVGKMCIQATCCGVFGLCCEFDDDCPDMFSSCSVDQHHSCIYIDFPLPDTGQVDCYDDENMLGSCPSSESHDYYGQDGQYLSNDRAYNVDTYTVTDDVTGLTWMIEDGGDEMTWNEALAYCEGSDLAEMTWRLPKRHELHSIVDYGVDSGTMLGPEFISTNFGQGHYWTATEVSEQENDYAWVIDFQNGTVKKLDKTSTSPKPQVRCVH